MCKERVLPILFRHALMDLGPRKPAQDLVLMLAYVASTFNDSQFFLVSSDIYVATYFYLDHYKLGQKLNRN